MKANQTHPVAVLRWPDAVAIANGFAAMRGRRYSVRRGLRSWIVAEVGS